MCFLRDVTVRYAGNGSGDVEIVPLRHLGVNDPRRSALKVLFLTILLMVELQSRRGRTYISGGIVAGVRLHTKTKIVHDNATGDKAKIKQTRSYAMNPLKLDLSERVGIVGKVSIWMTRALTPMFDEARIPGGAKLYPFTIGIG